MNASFNLTTEQWIPCINNRGEPVELSLVEMFGRAHELRGIESDNPLNVAALYRLSLAILHKAVKGPEKYKDWNELWKQGNFIKTPVKDYFEKSKDKFDLFSETNPFYQTASFETFEEKEKGKKKEKVRTPTPVPVTKLLIECSSLNNKTLFDHNMDRNSLQLSLRQAANALVTAQMFSLGGGKGPTSNLFNKHPNYAGCYLNMGVMVLLQGDSLFETLMLNLLIYNKDQPIPREEHDCPVWERTGVNIPGKRTPVGYLDLLTWKNRHVLLIPQTDRGRVIVKEASFGQGDSLSLRTIRIREPMFIYPAENKPPLSLSSDRAFWRDSSSLFAFKSGDDKRRPVSFRQAAELINKGLISPEKTMRCAVFGLAADQANPIFWRQEELPVSQKVLIDESLPLILSSALEWAEEVGEKLSEAVRKFASQLLTEGARHADRAESKKLRKALGAEAMFWASLEMPFREFLESLPAVVDLSEWKKLVVGNARNLFEKTTENFLNRSARELRARVIALENFNKELKKLLSPKKRRP